MKEFKSAASLIIAVFAIGFTITAQAGLLHLKTNMASGPCYRPNLLLRGTCSSSIVQVTSATACETVQNLVTPPNSGHLYALSTNPILEEEIETECPGGDLFCCAQIAIDSNPCLDQPLLVGHLGNAKYRIPGVDAVYCRVNF